MLSKSELRKVQRALASLEEDAALVLIRGGGSLREELEEFARTVAGLSDRLELRVLDGHGDVPGLGVERAGRTAVLFRLVPTGRLLAPFLEALTWRPPREAGTSGGAELLLFVTRSCPHCARVLRRCIRMSLGGRVAGCVVVDALAEEKLREEYAVTATPTLVVDGMLKLEGDVSEREIAAATEAVRRREERPGIVRQMLASGLAERAAKLALEDEAVARALVQLLADEGLRVRMGAMLALEELFRARPEMLERLEAELERMLRHERAEVRGDVAWLLERAKKFL
ncbi:MAG: hypothetical protein GXO66_05960 [Euryarchaeota archaeon]|nr:hypothetical protein [Euryarchaeota archaeon]